MSEKFDNEMRGSLFAVPESERKEKSPVATGTVQVSGVELRVAMWPARKAGGTGAGAGKTFWGLSLEYKQGTKFVLAKVKPENIVVTGASSTAETSSSDAEGSDAGGDMPF